MKIDLHVHTKYSPDCKEEPKDIIRALKTKGIEGVAITDHNTVRGGLAAKKLAGKDIEVIVGSEVMTEKGEVIGYFLNEEIGSKDFFTVVDEIHGQGGLACIPHPFDIIRYTSSLIPDDEMLKKIDMVEVMNSRCLLDRFNAKARKAAEKFGLTPSAGSDAHTVREVGDAGVVVGGPEDLRRGDVEIFGTATSLFQLIGSKIRRMV